MLRRTLRAPVLAAIAIVAAGLPATRPDPAAARSSERCERLSGRTVLANSVARIVRSSRYNDGIDPACSRKTGRITNLQRVPTQLVGSFAALFFPIPCGGDECTGTGAQLWDLRSGRVYRFLQTTAIRLLPGGIVVYLQGRETDLDFRGNLRPDAELTLRVFDRRRSRDLAVGRNIDSSSLAVQGSVVYYLEDGQPKAHRL